VRPLALQRRANGLELGLGEDLHLLCAAEPRRSKLHLRGRLLAGHEQRTAALRDGGERGEQKRRFPYARLTADQNERRGDETAAEHAIERGAPGRDPLGLVGPDVDQPQQRLRRGACTGGRSLFLDERPKGPAAGALAEPAAGRVAAFGARVL